MRRITSVFALVAAAALSLTACGASGGTDNASGGDQAGKALVVGASPSPHAEILQFIADNLAEKEGLKLEIKQFSDYVVPNTALQDKELDANYFQTVPYLEKESASRGFDFEAGKGIHLEPLGIFSEKVKELSELKEPFKVGIIKDPSNQGRALELLAANGLLELPKGEDPTVLNVKKLKDFELTPVDGPYLVRTLADVDIAVINGNYAQEGGLKIADALAVESPENNPAVNILAWRKGDTNPDIAKLEKLLHSDEVKEFIEKTWPDKSVIPAF